MEEAPRATASVVIVSDFASGTERGWDDIRAVLTALAQQDVTEVVDYILIESEELHDSLPPDLHDVLPGLRVVFSPATNSYALRNEGVRAARTEVVGTLDGDCTPDLDWVRLMIDAMRQHPQAAAVSGRTLYPGTSLYNRAAALLQRSYIEVKPGGRVRHIANNGAGYRRSVYLKYPLPTHLDVFAAQVQSEEMLAAGYELLFEPRMRVTHAFYPAFDADQHNGSGYGILYARINDSRLPYASLARLGMLSVAVFFFGRVGKAWLNAARHWSTYDVRWFELPAVFVLGLVGCAMEIPAMVRAVRGESPPTTSFR